MADFKGRDMRGEGVIKELTATALGLGRLPFAPGTWASAGAAAVYVALGQAPQPWATAVLWVLFGAAFVAGLAVCPWAEGRYGSNDPRPFVLDEVVGLWLVCLLFQWRGPVETAAAAFVAFRFFDVLKPFPIRKIEKLPGAWGVMLDDIGAAIYSAALLWPACHLLIDRCLPG